MGVSNYKTDLQKLVGYSINPSNPISTRYCIDIAWTFPSIPLDIGSTPFVPTTSNLYVNRIDQFIKNYTKIT